MLTPIPSDLVLSGRAANIRVAILDQDGALDVAASGITYGVTSADGSEVVAPGATPTIDAGVATAALTAAQTAALDVLTITWTKDDITVATSTVEVVSAYYVSVEEVRNSDPALRDTTKYPNADIIGARFGCERLFESELRRAYVPRYARDDVVSLGGEILLLPTYDVRRIRSVRQYAPTGNTYTTWTDDQLAAVQGSESGACVRMDGAAWPFARLVIEWEYGNSAPPADLRRLFTRWVRHELNANKSGIPDRATSYVDVGGVNFRVLTPGIGGSLTGMPDVDRALKRYGFRKMGVA